MPMTSTASFTRPADTTAYTSGDLVANSTTAGSVVPLEFRTSRVIGQGTIARIRLYKSNPTATNASFVVHLFTAAPVVANGDNGALSISTAANHIGSIACDMTSGGLAGTVGLSEGYPIDSGITFDLTAVPSERRLYGLIEAAAGYTPASGETFSVTLEIMN